MNTVLVPFSVTGLLLGIVAVLLKNSTLQRRATKTFIQLVHLRVTLLNKLIQFNVLATLQSANSVYIIIN